MSNNININNNSAKSAEADAAKQRLFEECDSLLSSGKCQSLSYYESKNDKTEFKCTARTRFAVLYIVLPSLMAWYAFGALFVSCINWTPTTGNEVSLFASVSGTWGFGLLLLIIRSLVYLPMTSFCDPLHRDNHKLLHWVIFLSYASILFTYELYLYTLSGWAILGGFVFWILYAGCYITLFLERHVRPCPAYGAPNKSLDGCMNKTLLILSGITHISLVVCCTVFNYQLFQPWRDDKVSCISPGTCECLSQ